MKNEVKKTNAKLCISHTRALRRPVIMCVWVCVYACMCM